MCPMWNAALECFVRSPPPTKNMRESREQDFDSVQAMSQRAVERGLTSWEHFQFPEQIQSSQCGVVSQSTSARTLGPEAWYNRTGTHLAA